MLTLAPVYHSELSLVWISHKLGDSVLQETWVFRVTTVKETSGCSICLSAGVFYCLVVGKEGLTCICPDNATWTVNVDSEHRVFLSFSFMWAWAPDTNYASRKGLWVPLASFLCPHWLSAAPPNSESSGCVINVLFTAPSRSLMKMLNKAWSQSTPDAPQSSVFCHLSVCFVYSPSSWSQPMGVLWQNPIWINFQ